ncbi:hypothetical protein AJ79_08094 [Helicocarpus griseus UAMH5409]|uniref:Uncharacterized protein n=1 Tax=Helicocarpus griseus UAMH5409 TaxID=1447875 RepID=A0A2B7WWH1_9EURO|nr:hypothetical protein AJ79_08094 [Helicocarpus griseus UAMH5409]
MTQLMQIVNPTLHPALIARLAVMEEPSTAGQETRAGHTGEEEGPNMQVCLYSMLELFTLKQENLYPRAAIHEAWSVALPRTLEISNLQSTLISRKINTFILPGNICKPLLILSPQGFLFGFLFSSNAFKATNLASVKKLRGLKIGDN